jgi:nucleotide-binding universal stress UspA family protein
MLKITTLAKNISQTKAEAKERVMKKILAGIDFSKGSLHAFDYALMVASVIGADIRMIWVDSSSSKESPFEKRISEDRREIRENFQKMIKKHAYKKNIGAIDYKIYKGKVAPEMARQAKIFDADFIIVGTHGITGFEEYWIGSNANRIIVYAECPVITVRDTFPLKRPKHIVIPIDNTRQTIHKVPFTANWARAMGAKITVVGIYSTFLQSMHKKVDQMVAKTCDYFKSSDISTRKEVLRTDNIANDLLDYIHSESFDLISIMTEQETTTSNMLLGQYAYQIVNNAKIPVLSIQEIKNFTTL